MLDMGIVGQPRENSSKSSGGNLEIGNVINHGHMTGEATLLAYWTRSKIYTSLQVD